MSTCRSVLLFSALFLFTAGVLGCTGTKSSTESDSDPVSVGYGQLEEDEVTSSVSQVKPENSDRESTTAFYEMLDRQAGVELLETGYGSEVRIRGLSTFNGDPTPLFVIDGVSVKPPRGQLPAVNPHDVESISVLKDGSATAIYGSRGGNGVIVIEMKE